MNTSPDKTVEQLRDALRTLSKLLDSFPHDKLVNALDEGNTRGAINAALERRKAWVKVFGDIADDLERQWNYMSKHKSEAVECMAMAKRGVELFNGKEFKEGVENLNKFVDLCVKLGALQESGMLRRIMEGMREIPPA